MTSAFPFPFSLPRIGVIAALVRRDYMVQRSYRLVFVLDVFYGIVNLLVFYFISQTFSDETTADLSGAPSYFAFASVGIAITIVLQAAGSHIGSARNSSQARWRRSRLSRSRFPSSRSASPRSSLDSA